MKNYDELTNDLLQRRDRYVADRKKKRKRAVSVAASLCCVCMAALLGFGMRQGGLLDGASPDRALEDTLPPDAEDTQHLGAEDPFDGGRSESVDTPVTGDKIVINSIEAVSADHNICLFAEDFVEMTRDEMVEYYGVDYIPEVPADIKPWEEERAGIYRRDGGTGEVYWDADILNYSNEDFTRNVHVEVDKDSYVLRDYYFFKGSEERSTINHHEVLIGCSIDGRYYSEFVYNGVGFCIDAEGVTEEEFVAMIKSVLA